MTKKDESPEEGANPYWSDELLAVLAEARFLTSSIPGVRLSHRIEINSMQ